MKTVLAIVHTSISCTPSRCLVSWVLLPVCVLFTTPSSAQIVVPPGYSAQTFYGGIPYPDGIAWKHPDTLLVVNEGGGPIGVFTAVRGQSFDTTDAFSTIGPPFVSPDDIYLHPNGEVFVADGQAGAVFKIAPSGGAPVLFSPIPYPFNPFGLALAPPSFSGPNVDPGDLIVADNAFGFSQERTVWSINPSTANARIIAKGTGFADGPLQVEFTPNGVLYVYENNGAVGTSRIVTLSADGVVSPFIVDIPDRGGLAINPITCQIYFGLVSANQIKRIPCSGGDPELFASGFLGLQDIRFSPDGTALYVSTPGGVVEIVGPFTTSVSGFDDVPTGFVLEQNYPNPFNPATTIRYHIANVGLVTLKMYDVLGREIATLVNEVKQPGTYTATWDASGFASGMYFYRLHAGSFIDTKKLILLK